MTDERLRELYQQAVAARAPGSRADCPAPERLEALARREGSEEERLRTLDHAMSCADCMRELELLRVIEKAGGRLSGGNAAARPRTLLPWRRVVPLALAASAVLAVSLVVRRRGDGDATGDPLRGGASALVLHTAGDVRLGARDSIVLAWRPDPGTTRYVVEVLDDDGRAVLSRSTTDTTFILRGGDGMTAGRDYRWWVRAFDAAGPQAASTVGRLRVTTP